MIWLGHYEELAWALVSSGGLAWMFHWSVWRLRLALGCHTFPQAQGTVVASDVIAQQSSRYSLRTPFTLLGVLVQYVYHVNGERYMGWDVRFTALYAWGQGRALQRYPPGTKVLVFYRPGHPGTAALEAGATVDGWIEAAAYGILLVLALTWTAYEVTGLLRPVLM